MVNVNNTYNVRIRELATRRVDYLCGQVWKWGRLSSSTSQSVYGITRSANMTDEVRDVNHRLLRKLTVSVVPSEVPVLPQNV